jgi:hypothetical protein
VESVEKTDSPPWVDGLTTLPTTRVVESCFQAFARLWIESG